MSPAWGLPFLGLILSVALLPALAPRLWHHRLGLIVAGWTLCLLLPFWATQGRAAVEMLLRQSLIGDYLPFVSLIFALSVAGGGIVLRGGPFGTPLGNTLLLGGGCLLGGLIGTTAAAMVLIHPLMAANAHRSRRFHLVLFFTALVANAGGALSPLAPPLLLGWLAGVPLAWPLLHLGLPTLFLAGLLLASFFALDRWLARRDPPAPHAPFRLRGLRNIALVATAAASLALPRLAGIALCLAVAALSLLATPRSAREHNMWGAAPVVEIGKLFLGLFVTMRPLIWMLQQGPHGPFASLLAAIHTPAGYFWVSGWLSAFLDNAPTYQLLFNLAGGNPTALSGPQSATLAAIAAGSVFFGALTYIGNAPNMMIQSIAARRGVRMPGFFTYFGWSALLLLPVLWIMRYVFF